MAVGVVLASAGRLEPRVRIGGVVHHEVHDHPDPVGSRGPDEFDEIAEIAQTRIHAEEVGDVVTVVLAGSRVEGHQPQAGNAEVGKVLDAFGHAADIAGTVAVPVVERLDVSAVEDRVLPPQVATLDLPHAVIAGTVGDSCGSTDSPNASMNAVWC